MNNFKFNNKFFKILSSIFIVIIFILFFNLNNNANFKNKMIIHYIDVGQGDCILIQVNNKNLLIDSGPSTNRKYLLNYLKKINIKKLDYIIETHPQDDHIGNMDTIIKRYNVEKFYSPKVTTSSDTFDSLLSALVDKNLKINVLKKGTNQINLGKNANLKVLSPKKDFTSDNLNNYSPIIKINFLNNSFLFTGDAETSDENLVLFENNDLKADVLKVGHHGSSTSTSLDFLNSVDPSVAIISVGKNNSYGHPSQKVLSLLDESNIKTLRTDISGNIIVISDGKNISITNIK